MKTPVKESKDPVKSDNHFFLAWHALACFLVPFLECPDLLVVWTTLSPFSLRESFI